MGFLGICLEAGGVLAKASALAGTDVLEAVEQEPLSQASKLEKA